MRVQMTRNTTDKSNVDSSSILQHFSGSTHAEDSKEEQPSICDQMKKPDETVDVEESGSEYTEEIIEVEVDEDGNEIVHDTTSLSQASGSVEEGEVTEEVQAAVERLQEVDASASVNIVLGLFEDNPELLSNLRNYYGTVFPDVNLITMEKPELIQFLESQFPESRIPTEQVVLQRLSIYYQLYKKGGIFINPSSIGELDKNTMQLFDAQHRNVFLLLDRVQDMENCILAGKRHAIRKGQPERSLQVHPHFLVSKKSNHPFWLRAIGEILHRYDQSVPLGERVQQLSYYGKSFLVGGDLLSEVVHEFRGNPDVNDIAIVTPKAFNRYFQVRV